MFPKFPPRRKPKTPTHENVYRPEGVHLSYCYIILRNVFLKSCYVCIYLYCVCIYIYICINLHCKKKLKNLCSVSMNIWNFRVVLTFFVFIPRFLAEPLTIFCRVLGFPGTLVGKHCCRVLLKGEQRRCGIKAVIN
jgi:hypothetical protein